MRIVLETMKIWDTQVNIYIKLCFVENFDVATSCTKLTMHVGGRHCLLKITINIRESVVVIVCHLLE